MSRITVAIPTYNRKEHLQECLNSVISQSVSDFDIYVFDNCSDYDVEDFIKGFNDKRIKLITSDQNLGNIGNFQRIFSYNFSSEYLVVFHDDDTMHPNFLEINYKHLENNKRAVFSASKINFIKDPKQMRVHKDSIKSDKLLLITNPKGLVELFISNFNLSFSSVVYRVSLLEENFKYLAQKYNKWCDRPYLIGLAEKGPVLIIDEKLVNYRLHSDQDSQAYSANNADGIISLLSLYKKTFLLPGYSKIDCRKFYIFSTNIVILSSFSFAKNYREVINFIRKARFNNLFKVYYINYRGIYYIIKNISKIISLKK